jgi:pimeloyl-ACP methyl ester carboxylesterase
LGGSGKPLVLLTGLGNTARIFDKFAPKLATDYHVYRITRRGFGASSRPATGYSAERLGDDVLAVMDSLHLNRPVLVGHSIAGEELSSVGSRPPDKIAGVVYLDAGYTYAYYDPASAKLFQELQPPTGIPGPADAILKGGQKYTKIPVPILAIFAAPPNLAGGSLPSGTDRASIEKLVNALSDSQTAAFEMGLPTARVVRSSHANHYVFQSKEADVREMNNFLAGPPAEK